MQELAVIHQTTQLFIQDFRINMEPPQLEEAELLDMIAEVVGQLMERRFEFLLQTLYRLDVDEEKMRSAFAPSNPEPANLSLAKAILERQKQKVLTRHQYKSKKQNIDWFDFD